MVRITRLVGLLAAWEGAAAVAQRQGLADRVCDEPLGPPDVEEFRICTEHDRGEIGVTAQTPEVAGRDPLAVGQHPGLLGPLPQRLLLHHHDDTRPVARDRC